MNQKQTPDVDAAAAIEIWNAGVEAVDAEELVRDAISIRSDSLVVAGETYDLRQLKTIVVIGFGKCSGAMAAGLESAVKELRGVELSGLVIVPEGQTATSERVTTVIGRSRASNFPTETVVERTKQMLEMITGVDEDALIVAMVSGGGSALLERPLVPLKDLIALSQSLSRCGASIESLNTVRRALSSVKAGGLARYVLEHSRASMVGLIISDVIGDALGMVASGPTVISAESITERRIAAREIITKFELQDAHRWIYNWLDQEVESLPPPDSVARIKNHLIANNSTAVDAARRKAADLGFLSGPIGNKSVGAIDANRDVNEVAEDWVELAMKVIGDRVSADCAGTISAGQATAFVAGGEPTVVLCDSPGRGGRNLQLTALVLLKLSERGVEPRLPIAFVSGATDGEDGSATVAGACFDSEMLRNVLRTSALRGGLQKAVLTNDCDAFFQRHGGRVSPPAVLTNVCDLHVMLIGGLAKET